MSLARSPLTRLLALVAAIAAAPACDGPVSRGAAPTGAETSPPVDPSISFVPSCGGGEPCVALELAAPPAFSAPAPLEPTTPAVAPRTAESRREPPLPSAGPGAVTSACHAGWRSGPSPADLPLPDDVRSFDHLGLNVALDGRFLAAGADGDDARGVDAGVVWVYERDDAGAFLPSEPLVASDAFAQDHFGWQLDLDGGVLAVAAPRHAHGGGFETGAVYVFELVDGAWTEVAELVGPVTREAGFGDSVRVRGDQILVGAQRDGVRGEDVGAAFLYERGPDGVWALVTRLDPRAAHPGARVGAGLALARDLAVVGGDGEDGGAAWIFRRHAGVWREVARLSPPDRSADALFGGAVDVDGRTLLVGGQGQEVDGVAEVGAVWAWVLEGDTWSPRGRVTPPIAVAGAHFGASIRLDGDLAAIGA
ncbi:MAG: hypothetical protein KC635_20460, partial [Myxococcales bacterium]|nr:hypothetical protein [Myxococcales bacterium]